MGMLLAPPAAAVIFGMTKPAAGLAVYAVLMLGLGVCAAGTISKDRLARAAIGVALAVGMLFVQCAVVFVGCSILMQR